VIEEPDNLIFKQLHILRQLKRDKLLEDEVVIKLQEKLALEYITSLNTETSVSPVKSINNRDMKARASIARKIQIFLASSEELREDRDKFEIYFRQLNDELLDKGLYLVIKRWENFLDAMSETRLQDEYNKAVKGCDIFVSLFFTKTGKFTDARPVQGYWQAVNLHFFQECLGQYRQGTGEGFAIVVGVQKAAE
jgi:hypothetical protein